MTLHETSIADPRILANPNQYYALLRKNDPVHYDEKLSMYVVSRYEDLQQVLRDPITYSLELGYNKQYALGFRDELKQILIRDGGGFFPDVIMTDPPTHTRIRRLVEKAFTAHRVKLLEPAMAALAGDMVEKLADKGHADGVKDLAMPMTIRIMCAQLGLGQIETETVHRWSQAYVAQLGALQSREQMLHYGREICDLQNYIIDRVREREQERREDMISDLVYARTDEEAAPTLNFDEVVSLSRALLVGGNDTTAAAIANLLFIIATRPQFAKELYASLDDDRLLARFVEEVLRLEPPVRGLSRVTTKEVELGGKKLPSGAHVLLLFASANDDETVFTCPRDFDMSRKNLARHLSFGAGTHICIGMALARMEVKIVAREIMKRLENIKLSVPVEDIRFVPTIATRSMESLPLIFTRRTA